MSEIDIDLLSRQVLRRLRGSRSQVQFSRRLGYRSNVAATWESGVRAPTTTTVFAAAPRLGLDVAKNLRVFLGHTEPPDLSTREGLATLLTDLKRDRPTTEIAERSGFSRFQVARWLKGDADPRLAELLQLVHTMTSRLLDFVSVLVDPAEIPSVAESWSRLEAARSLFWRYPRAQIVLLSLELSDYVALPAHDDIWLARRLGIPLYEVIDLLERLEQTGQIAHNGSHWHSAEVRAVDTRKHPDALEAIRGWWWEEAGRRIHSPGASVSWNAFPVTREEREEIVEVYRTAFRRMRAIVAESPGGPDLVLVQSAVVPLVPYPDSHIDGQ